MAWFLEPLVTKVGARFSAQAGTGSGKSNCGSGRNALSLVMRGLDPRIHAASPPSRAGGTQADASLQHGLPGQARQ